MQKVTILLLFSLGVFFSCKEKNTPIEPIPNEPIQVKIDSVPHLKFGYELLDSGFVQFHNLSTNYDPKETEWYSKYFRSKEDSPKFRFQHNGNYSILVQLTKTIGTTSKSADTTMNINISNAVKLDKDRIIEGIAFDEPINFTSETNDYRPNSLLGSWPFGFPPYPPCVSAYKYDNTPIPILIVIADYNQPPSKDLNSMRKNFTKGIKPIVKFKAVGEWESGWSVWIGTHIGMTNNQSNYAYSTDMANPNDFLEITEVKEVHQPYLFPNHESTAFLVTFHFKTITKEGKKIDLKIPVKYMAYKASDWY